MATHTPSSTWDAPSPRLVINTTQQLHNILIDSDPRQQVLTTPSLWLADLSDDMIHVGGWSALRWPDRGAFGDTPRIRPWYELFVLLATRTEPFHELTLHSSVLSHWAKASKTWLADGSRRRTYDPCNLVTTLAYNLTVAHLVTWGSVYEDEVLDRICVTESFTVRGCQHSFTKRAFGHLTANTSTFDTVTFIARQDVNVRQMERWLEHLAWTQRGRVLYSRPPFKVFRLVLPDDVTHEHSEWLQDVWYEMPHKYTQGADLEIDTHHEEHPDDSQMDHERRMFGLNINGPPRKGCNYVWPDRSDRWSPATHCLCPVVPVAGFKRFDWYGFNAYNTTDEHIWGSPGSGSLQDDRLAQH